MDSPDSALTHFLQQGIMIEGGYTESSGSYDDGGGFRSFAQTTLINVLMTKNTAADAGGALYQPSMGGNQITLIDTVISDNTASRHGGIYAESTVVMQGRTRLDGNSPTQACSAGKRWASIGELWRERERGGEGKRGRGG